MHQSEIKTKHNFDNFHIVSQPLIIVVRMITSSFSGDGEEFDRLSVLPLLTRDECPPRPFQGVSLVPVTKTLSTKHEVNLRD